jgi:hypothetical protein
VEPIVIAMGLATMLCVLILFYALWLCLKQGQIPPERAAEETEAEETPAARHGK